MMFHVKTNTSFSYLFGCILGLSSVIHSAFAHPVASSELLDRRAGGSAPYFVIYTNQFGGQQGPPPANKLKGFNVVALSFLQSSKAVDKVAEWANIPVDRKAQLKKEYEAAGIKIVVSLFGMMDKPTTQGIDPVKFGNAAADWVRKNNVHGVDVDYEDLDAMNKGDGKAEQWVITLTKTLRRKLPQGTYLISHAPLAPWWSSTMYKGGGYLKIHKEVGSMIDFYTTQFYNQGADAYTTCASLLHSSKFAGTSLFEIHKAGVPLKKLVVGKPGSKASATNGFMDTKTLGKCVDEAKKGGWAGGIGAWEYPAADSRWIQEAKGNAFAGVGGQGKIGAGNGKRRGSGPGNTQARKRPGT